MMTIVYIIIGVAVGAVAVFLWMNQRIAGLRVDLAKKETEMQLLSQQRMEEQQRTNRRVSASSLNSSCRQPRSKCRIWPDS